jgi:predicted RNA-binding Zn-ribbon protein involved in translation (DUF1610 family)
MDGLPVKRTASVMHECRKCGVEIERHEECYTIPQRQYPSRKFFTLYLCEDCGLKHIAVMLDKARREVEMIEAAR